MAYYDNYKIWFWDDSLSALGSTTRILSARYKAVLDQIGEGEFTIPLVDTKTRQWIEKYNIATFTCEINGAQVCFGEIVIEHADEVIVKDGPDLLVVTGRGHLSKLTLDRMNYQVISNGAQGAVATAIADILALSQYATWATSTYTYSSFVNASAYLVTANETLFDAVLQALAQKNHHLVDVPGYGNTVASSETPENRLHYIYNMDALNPSPGAWGSFHFKKAADPTDNYEAPILSLSLILEEKEVVTKAIVHGGGLGSGTFTMEAASGTKTAPSGFTYDFTNSTIVNDTLEAISNQPRKTAVANLSNIKPEDPADATAVLTAAEQLVDAGQRWLEERAGGYDEYYRVESVARYETVGSRSWVMWPGVHAARLEWDKDSPYNTSDAEVATTIIDIDKALHVLEAEYSVQPGTGPDASKLMGVFLLGPAPRQERDGDAMVADELGELRRRLDHADAQAASSTTPGGTTYVTTDAPLLTAAASSALANERAGTDGNGTIFTDNGAGVTFQTDIRTPLSVGSGSTNSAGNSSTGHTHAANLTATDIPAHVIATTSGLGSQHTVSGLTARQVLIATGSTTALFRALVSADLPTGATLSVSSSNSGNSHAITSSSAVSSATAVLLATDSNGRSRVQGLAIGESSTEDALQISKSSGSPAIIVTAATNGEMAVPDSTFWRMGHWNSGTSTFTERISMDGNGALFVGETADTKGTVQFVLNQGSNTDQARAMKASYVAHGITDQAETDTWLSESVVNGTEGGARLTGLRDGSGSLAMLIRGIATAGDTTKSTAADGAVKIIGGKKSGTNGGALGTNGNILAVADWSSTRWIVDAEGDTHRDGSDNTFDIYHDAHLARAFDLAVSPGSVIDSEFDGMLQYGRDDLIAAGILHESGFYNESRLLRLVTGGVWQGYIRDMELQKENKRLSERVAELERRLTDGN